MLLLVIATIYPYMIYNFSNNVGKYKPTNRNDEIIPQGHCFRNFSLTVNEERVVGNRTNMYNAGLHISRFKGKARLFTVWHLHPISR